MKKLLPLTIIIALLSSCKKEHPVNFASSHIFQLSYNGDVKKMPVQLSYQVNSEIPFNVELPVNTTDTTFSWLMKLSVQPLDTVRLRMFYNPPPMSNYYYTAIGCSAYINGRMYTSISNSGPCQNEREIVLVMPNY